MIQRAPAHREEASTVHNRAGQGQGTPQKASRPAAAQRGARLTVAVQQHHWRALAAMAHPQRHLSHADIFEREVIKHELLLPATTATPTPFSRSISPAISNHRIRFSLPALPHRASYVCRAPLTAGSTSTLRVIARRDKHTPGLTRWSPLVDYCSTPGGATASSWLLSRERARAAVMQLLERAAPASPRCVAETPPPPCSLALQDWCALWWMLAAKRVLGRAERQFRMATTRLLRIVRLRAASPQRVGPPSSSPRAPP